ncbi:MAG: hypothetical protein JWM35_2115 [Verrucomicrobia bacterium]|nr:hypothetical protein [Verrucomicrobiota bacterium]
MAKLRRAVGIVRDFVRARSTAMKTTKRPSDTHYSKLVSDLSTLLDIARRTTARAVNSVMTTTYWELGRRIVEFEQKGKHRADYGEILVGKLAQDLTTRFGRGFGPVNLSQMKRFYLMWPAGRIFQTLSEKFDATHHQALSGKSPRTFPLPWSHYVRLMTVEEESARYFYETEALRGGWSVRQLARQVGSMFYERTALSRDRAAMLTKGSKAKPEDRVNADEELKDPLVLEFLNLKDEYSESEMEGALLTHLEQFLLELGGDFTFVSRQRRLRIGDAWYRVDLLFYHRRLRCLVVIDLKIGEFTHADAGQMHVYLNYAKKHWTNEGENPPVGLILCSKPNEALAEYALEGLPNKVLARQYKLALPAPKLLTTKLEGLRERLESRRV